MRFAIVALLLATGCGSAERQAAEDYASAVADARQLAVAHQAAVQQATDCDEVDAMEQQYLDDWAGMRERMADCMQSMGTCGHMADASETMDMMDDEVRGHVAMHTMHDDMSDCLDAEQDHVDAMFGFCGDMMSDGGMMDGGMMGGGMMGGGMMGGGTCSAM